MEKRPLLVRRPSAFALRRTPGPAALATVLLEQHQLLGLGAPSRRTRCALVDHRRCMDSHRACVCQLEFVDIMMLSNYSRNGAVWGRAVHFDGSLAGGKMTNAD